MDANQSLGQALGAPLSELEMLEQLAKAKMQLEQFPDSLEKEIRRKQIEGQLIALQAAALSRQGGG